MAKKLYTRRHILRKSWEASQLIIAVAVAKTLSDIPIVRAQDDGSPTAQPQNSDAITGQFDLLAHRGLINSPIIGEAPGNAVDTLPRETYLDHRAGVLVASDQNGDIQYVYDRNSQGWQESNNVAVNELVIADVRENTTRFAQERGFSIAQSEALSDLFPEETPYMVAQSSEILSHLPRFSFNESMSSPAGIELPFGLGNTRSGADLFELTSRQAVARLMYGEADGRWFSSYLAEPNQTTSNNRFVVTAHGELYNDVDNPPVTDTRQPFVWILRKQPDPDFYSDANDRGNTPFYWERDGKMIGAAHCYINLLNKDGINFVEIYPHPDALSGFNYALNNWGRLGRSIRGFSTYDNALMLTGVLNRHPGSNRNLNGRWLLQTYGSKRQIDSLYDLNDEYYAYGGYCYETASINGTSPESELPIHFG